MTIDKKELTKLSPQDRIKKLKLMEEERKKEVDEIEKLINASMQELKTGKIAEEIVPEQRAVDISRLFEASGGQRLERTVRQEAPPAALTKGTKGYNTVMQTYQDYSQLKRFYSILSMEGSLTEEQIGAIGQIGERITRAERYMTEGEKSASKLDASRVVLYKLKKETGL
ncbi:hypothetical protein HYX00_03935 [Candidatus Woesearchaeota archaeon]|nr:hypothetical protein [Candidatus Woesearchaeota archaeon]